MFAKREGIPTDNQNSWLGFALVRDFLLSRIGPVLRASLLSMLDALGSSFAELLWVAIDFVKGRVY